MKTENNSLINPPSSESIGYRNTISLGLRKSESKDESKCC